MSEAKTNRSETGRSLDRATAAVHADRALRDTPDVGPPLRPSTTFIRTDHGPVYRRDWDPTTQRLEAVLGALEGGSAVCYPSGLGAVAALLALLGPARVSLPEECYHGVRDHVLAEGGRGRWQVVHPTALGSGDLQWLETPSNPTCRIADVAAVSEANRGRGVLTAVDATFATPVLQRTLDLGADFVMHSTTKFIAGHSDAMGGVIVTRDPVLADRLLEDRVLRGLVPGALETWLTLRGVRTLPLRMERMSATALEIAEFLEPRVPQVHYPGLSSHSGHELALRQMEAFGGVVSFEMESSVRAASVVERLELFGVATSLGGVESLAEHRILADPDAPPGLIRLSVGLEASHDLIFDLESALASTS